jgi:spore coat protein SA
LKLLFITSGTLPMPPASGGAVETLIDLILKNNEASGRYDITVCSVYSETAEQQSKRYRHSDFFYVKNQGKDITLKRAVRHFINKIPGVYIGNYFISKVLERFARSLRDYDAVIVENAPLYGLLLKRFRPKKLILHLHNDLLNPQVKLARSIYDCYDEIYTLSDFVHRRVEEIAKDSKVKTLYNGVDVERFRLGTRVQTESIRQKYSIPENHTVVLYMGRLVPEKGVKELLQAFSTLPAGSDITLVIVGSPVYGRNIWDSYVTELHQIAEKCRNPVKFAGYIAQREMPELYAMADFAVIPSIWEEPFALTVVEAMASGLPVIVSDSGGMVELVDMDCAVIVHRGDRFVSELSTAIKNLKQNKKLREVMGVNAYRRSLQFDKVSYLARFDQLLEC